MACSTVALSAAAALSAPGDLDPGFGTGGVVSTDFGTGRDVARDLVLQPDGKLVAAGVSGCMLAVARYRPDGSLDPGFGAGGRVTTAVESGCSESYALARQADGKLVTAGRVSGAGGTDFVLARHDVDGTLDASFGDGGVVTTDLDGGTDRIWDLAVQPDGKLVAAGRTTSCAPFCSGPSVFVIARYETDGSLDESFGTDGLVRVHFFDGGDGEAFAVALQPDGKIVAGGIATPPALPGPPVQRRWVVARLGTNGSPDASFGVDGKAMALVSGGGLPYTLAIQSDGKLVVGGWGGSSPGPQGASLVRFATNGALDQEFGVGGQVVVPGFGEIHAVAVQADGKLVAAGGESFDFALWRFVPDGSLDSSFGSDGVVLTDVPGSILGEGARALAMYPGGRIVLAGGDEDFVLARYIGDPAGVEFASLRAKAMVVRSNGSANDVVALLARLELGSGSDGIDAAHEAVGLRFGGYAVTLPPGSFGTIPGGWSFRGEVEGARWHVTVVRAHNGGYLLGATGSGLDLEVADNPVALEISIGDDRGRTMVTVALLPRNGGRAAAS